MSTSETRLIPLNALVSFLAHFVGCTSYDIMVTVA